MARTNSDRILRRAGRMATRIRVRIREAASRNQFGPGRVDEADARWPSDFWQDHRA